MSCDTSPAALPFVFYDGAAGASINEEFLQREERIRWLEQENARLRAEIESIRMNSFNTSIATVDHSKRILGIDIPAAELTRNTQDPGQAVLRIQELARARGIALDYSQASEQYHIQLDAHQRTKR